LPMDGGFQGGPLGKRSPGSRFGGAPSGWDRALGRDDRPVFLVIGPPGQPMARSGCLSFQPAGETPGADVDHEAGAAPRTFIAYGEPPCTGGQSWDWGSSSSWWLLLVRPGRARRGSSPGVENRALRLSTRAFNGLALLSAPAGWSARSRCWESPGANPSGPRHGGCSIWRFVSRPGCRWRRRPEAVAFSRSSAPSSLGRPQQLGVCCAALAVRPWRLTEAVLPGRPGATKRAYAGGCFARPFTRPTRFPRFLLGIAGSDRFQPGWLGWGKSWLGGRHPSSVLMILPTVSVAPHRAPAQSCRRKVSGGPRPALGIWSRSQVIWSVLLPQEPGWAGSPAFCWAWRGPAGETAPILLRRRQCSSGAGNTWRGLRDSPVGSLFPTTSSFSAQDSARPRAVQDHLLGSGGRCCWALVFGLSLLAFAGPACHIHERAKSA